MPTLFANELGRADLPVRPDAQQRVPTGCTAPMGNLGTEEATHRQSKLTDKRTIQP